MTNKENWQLFENYLVSELQILDKKARRTKGSGNKGEKGDIKTTLPLHIEAKCYQKKNVYNEDWMTKCIQEVPFHSNKIPVLITKNNKNQIRVHMEWLDFLQLYIEFHNLKYGEENEYS